MAELPDQALFGNAQAFAGRSLPAQNILYKISAE
jgi:hypothetical protein